MTAKAGKKKATRRQHSPEFRKEARALAEKVGIRQAAKELGDVRSVVIPGVN